MIRVAAVFAALAVVVTGCQVGEDPTASKGSKSGAAGGSSTEKDAATSVTDWLTAAVDLDGKKYCGQLTVDLQEQLTGSQSDQATQRCERAVSSAVAGRLPLRIAVVAEEAGSQTANVNLASEVPQKADLLKEQGSFKIDDAGESAKEGEDPGGRPGSTQEEKDAEEAVKTLIKAAIDEDGKTYCSQLTTRFVERLTNARADQAKKKCERLVTAEESPTKIPVDIDVVAKSSKESAAEASIRAELVRSLKLRKEDGSLKVDSFGNN